MSTAQQGDRRVLVIDDSESIHGDFRKILGCDEPADAELDSIRSSVFGSAPSDTATMPALTYTIDSALQGEEGFKRVEASVRDDRRYCLAFVDMRMPPGWDGLKTIEHLWRADPDLQVVICTAYSDHSWEQILTRLGETDQLLILKKPFDPIEVRQIALALTKKWHLADKLRNRMDELDRMVSVRTRELSESNEELRTEIVRREKAEDELRHTALHDPLTGLPNRMQVTDALARCVERTARVPGYGFAVLFLDLDNFKRINDSLGHDAGDQLLQEIAHRLVRGLRGLDVVGRNGNATAGRLGGDEFVIVLDEIPKPSDAVLVSERIQRLIGEPVELQDRSINVTASIGVALSSDGYIQPTDILRNADTAMYRAKHGGKARLSLYNDAMHRDVMERLELENDLRAALEKQVLNLVYQPIIDLERVRIYGFEALLRWNRPGKGPVAPETFITVAEETGLVIPLGLWVLNEACRQLSAWRRKQTIDNDICVSVNVSKRQLAAPGFCEDVSTALSLHQILPTRLNLEITESAIIDAPDQVEA